MQDKPPIVSHDPPTSSQPNSGGAVEWNCPTCTFINNDTASVCEMCECKRPTNHVMHSPVQFNDVSALIPNVVTQNNNALEILNTVEAEVDSVAAAFETASSTYRKEMLTLNELLTQKLLRLDAMKDLEPDMREKRKQHLIRIQKIQDTLDAIGHVLQGVPVSRGQEC